MLEVQDFIFSYEVFICYSFVTGVKYHAFRAYSYITCKKKRAYSYTENFGTPSKPRPIFLFSVVAMLQAKTTQLYYYYILKNGKFLMCKFCFQFFYQRFFLLRKMFCAYGHQCSHHFWFFEIFQNYTLFCLKKLCA
jgi:hypothetical protein